jgi:hypothetical protein
MWTVEWTALSARIASLIEAGSLQLTTVTPQTTGCYNVSKDLLQNAHGVVKQLKLFHRNHAEALPEAARDCLKQILDRYRPFFEEEGRDNLPLVQAAVTLLASFRAEFTYLVSDTEAIARSRVAHAFAHLQRSIVADDSVRDRWNKVFCQGETACEKLGATHFLLHGVWAFKANAEGGRTDLVLGNPLMVDDGVRAAADALVLTEWKVVRDKKELDKKAR